MSLVARGYIMATERAMYSIPRNVSTTTAKTALRCSNQ
jgi:hypothetical protein